jgi:hypothetical protein
MHQDACNNGDLTREHSCDHAVFLDAGVEISSVVSRSVRLRATACFIGECHKDFCVRSTVENGIHELCNLSHDDSSCTVAMRANRVILDPHFSPFVLPSRTTQRPLQRLVVCSHRSDPPGDLLFIFVVVESRSQ